MNLLVCSILLVLFLSTYVKGDSYNSEEVPNFFLKASKSVPRIGRRGKNDVDFENFFLKASKSVPRIGRRSMGPDENEIDAFYRLYNAYVMPKRTIPEGMKGNSDEDTQNVPTRGSVAAYLWSDIADKFERNPDALIRQANEIAENSNRNNNNNNNNKVKDWDKMRYKRTDFETTKNTGKELEEVRFQPDV